MKQQAIVHNCIIEDEPSLITDIHSGEVCCSTCGEVLDERIIDRSSETRSFTKEEYISKTRNGSPSKISMFDMGNSSAISKSNTDASGNSLSARNKSHFSRIRLWDSRSKKSSKERSLVNAFTLLDSFTNKLALPENVKEQSAYIYRKAVDKKIIRGSSVRATMAGAVYAACKQSGIPRTLDEVSNTANINRKTLSRAYRRLIRKLDLDVSSIKIDYISKVANSAKVGEKIRRISSNILEDAKKKDVHVGKNPIGLAAASVYLSSIGNGKDISMASLSRKSNISTVTIRKLVRMLKPFASKYIQTIEAAQ